MVVRILSAEFTVDGADVKSKLSVLNSDLRRNSKFAFSLRAHEPLALALSWFGEAGRNWCVSIAIGQRTPVSSPAYDCCNKPLYGMYVSLNECFPTAIGFAMVVYDRPQ